MKRSGLRVLFWRPHTWLSDMPLTPEEIAARFDISLPAAKVRAKELARLHRRTTGEMRMLPNIVVDFLKDQQRKGFRVTRIPPAKEQRERGNVPEMRHKRLDGG